MSGKFDNGLGMSDVMENIESFIGSVTIPLGLIGPLSMNWGGPQEPIFGAAATIEGALIVSINRGCRAIASETAIQTEVQSKCMTRMPMLSLIHISEPTRRS